MHGEVIAEPERLRANDLVRVIGLLAACKDADSELRIGPLRQPLRAGGNLARIRLGVRADE